MRAADILGRYGGEEFVVLMPETDLNTARQIAERLRENIRTLIIATERAPIRFTASIGIAALDHARDATIDALIARADQAMYAAKRAGRNRVFATLVRNPKCLSPQHFGLFVYPPLLLYTPTASKI